MPRYLSDYVTGKRSVDQPNGVGILKVPLLMALPAALVAGDILSLLRIPAGVRLVDFDVISPQLDSNGAPTLACSIGVENVGGTDLATVYEAGLIFGRGANGSISRASSGAQLAADASVDRTISLKVTTAPATAALAGKTLMVLLHLQG